MKLPGVLGSSSLMSRMARNMYWSSYLPCEYFRAKSEYSCEYGGLLLLLLEPLPIPPKINSVIYIYIDLKRI